LISNSNFKIQFEFEKVFNMKLVEHEILKISYFEIFSSCYIILGVIWQKQFEFENLGVATVADESPPGTERHGHRRATGLLPGCSREHSIATSSARAF
jgi:hypothetical protein